MAKKGTIKLRIPGSKKEIEVPRWAAYAVGGGALLAVVLMRDGKSSRGDGDGLLASEMSQRLEEQRQWFGTALGDVAARVEELSFQEQEELFEPTTPSTRGNGKKDELPQNQFIPGYGQQEIGTVQFLTTEPTSDAGRELTRAEQTYAERLQAIAEGYASGKIIGTAGGTPVLRGLESARDTVVQTVSKPTETTAQKTARLQEQFEAQRRLRLIEEAEDVTPWSIGVSESLRGAPTPYGTAPTSMNVAREEEDKLDLVQRTEASRWQAQADYWLNR